MPDDVCCTRQADLLEASILLSDAFELVRANNSAAAEHGITAVKVLQATVAILKGGDVSNGAHLRSRWACCLRCMLLPLLQPAKGAGSCACG